MLRNFADYFFIKFIKSLVIFDVNNISKSVIVNHGSHFQLSFGQLSADRLPAHYRQVANSVK